jgi:hypothetical protein
VFDASLAAGRDDVVFAHLNHRLVQMCLRLLRAEVWSLDSNAKRLSRVSACIIDNATLIHPVVIAYGRIVVLGGDNQRLHEEIITAGGALRDGRFSRLNVSEIKAALASTTQEAVPEMIETHCRGLWPKCREPLLTSLDVRMTERTKNLAKDLQERAERDANKLTAIMTELQKTIQAQLSSMEGPRQLTLFEVDEVEQWERDRAALRRRLKEIPEEIAHESAHIRSRFANPSARLFPVAVTWLIPRQAMLKIMEGKQ